MKEASVRYHEPFVPNDEPTEVANPRKRPLNDPAVPVPPKFATVLMGCAGVVGPGRNDGLDVASGQAPPKRIAVVGPIADQPIRARAGSPGPSRAGYRDRLESLFEERDFRRGSRVQVCSQRSTLASFRWIISISLSLI